MGLAIGWGNQQLRSRLDDVTVIQNTVSLLTPYAAYVPADHAGLSGVLAVVSTGLYLGWHSPQRLSPPRGCRRMRCGT
jgi:CPA1 family monovalent cation:H+ antiporter